MSEHKIQGGYIDCLDKPYIFTYDGELLQLVPKEIESIRPFDSLANKNVDFEILEGTTQQLEKIYFLNGRLNVYQSGYIAKPSGYICLNGNIDTFEVITFRSGIMDFFYRTNQVVDKNQSSYDLETGEGIIKLRSFEETNKSCSVSIDGKGAELMLSITRPALPTNLAVDYNLGKPQTVLTLTFEEPVKVSEFRKIYMWIYNLMVFLNFRKDVFIGKIDLGNLNNERKIAPIAYTHIIESNKNDIKDIDNIIGYYFISKHINELLQLVNKPELNLLFIPDSVKDDKYISPEKYMVCCTSFESVFNFVFPNAKMEYSKNASEVREEFLKYIADKDKEYKGVDKKKRKEFNKYADIIRLLDFGLAEKFEQCQLRFEKIIDHYIKKHMHRLSITKEELDNMAQLFAEKRNKLIHSSLEDFKDIHVFAYLLARVFIYCMILEKAGVKDDMIIQGVDSII